MPSRLPTPWWLPRHPAGASDLGAPAVSLAATPVLDLTSARVRRLVRDVRAGLPAGAGEREALQRAHRLVTERVRPVYAVDDAQPASRTLALGRGSCTQRLAVLEAAARSLGVATRVRGLLVDGRFWYPRFPRLRFAVPDVVVLAWPELRVEGAWEDAGELFGPLGSASAGSTNAGGETLFDAVARTAVDWDGATRAAGACSPCDLSGVVLRDLGRFDSRDDLFAAHGQTLCWGARTLGGPVLGRWSAGAAAAS